MGATLQGGGLHTGPAPRSPGMTRRALPGFGLSLGLTLAWLSAIVLLPLAALVAQPWQNGLAGLAHTLTDPRTAASLRLSLGMAALAAAVDVPLGLLLAWTVVRTRFPGRRMLDAVLDLPFALPTSVAGITLATLYGPSGWIGAPLAAIGIKVAYTPLGILVALVFVGIPFVVRTVEPVLRDLPRETEEAAATLGAWPGQIALRVILPALLPALLTGFALAFARALGEYGSIIFIAGNKPLQSEIAPLLIVIRLQEFDYAGAATLGVAMLAISLVSLGAVTLLRRYLGRVAA